MIESGQRDHRVGRVIPGSLDAACRGIADVHRAEGLKVELDQLADVVVEKGEVDGTAGEEVRTVASTSG